MQKLLTTQNKTLHNLTRLICLFLLLTLASCGGSEAPAPLPVITSFTAISKTVAESGNPFDDTTTSINITLGETAIIPALFVNGTGEIDNGVGTVASFSSVEVTPTVDTTYTLTVTNTDGKTVTASVTVIVAAAPVILRFIKDTPGTVASGTMVNLAAEYTTDNTDADKAVISDGINPDVNINSSIAGAPGDPTDPIAVTVNNTTAYTLTVKNSAGTEVTLTITIIVDPISASAEIRPIVDSSDIVIFFNTPMDTNLSNLTLGGDLGSQAGTKIWSDFFGTDKKLTLSPTTNWTSGIAQSLTIVAQDKIGNSTGTLSFDFDIAAGTIHFVDSFAGGTKQTIIDEIGLASNGDIIAVNNGTYSGTSPIVLKDGIFLLGGYEQFFTDRDSVLFETIVTDTSSTTTGDATAPNAVIEASTGITSATIVDGFTLNGSTDATTDFTSGILIINGADPIIQNNIINGGGDASNDTSYGIYTDGTATDPIIRNNLITGGTSPISFGLNINGATAGFILRNNTINAGSGFTAAHAISNTDATPIVENNLVFSSGGDSTCYIETDSTLPSSLRNNDFFNCFTIYSDFDAGCAGGSLCTLVETNALTGASNNINDFPFFVDDDGIDNDITTMADNDWRLSVTTPVSVSAGGLNGIDAGFGFTKDLDGATRPASATPWSIGAYEP